MDFLGVSIHHGLGGRPLWLIVNGNRNGAEAQANATISGHRLNRVLAGFNGHFALDTRFSAYFTRCNEACVVATYANSADPAPAVRAAEASRAALVDACGGKLSDVTLGALNRAGADVQMTVRKAISGFGRIQGISSNKHDFTTIQLSPEPLSDDTVQVAIRAANDISNKASAGAVLELFQTAGNKGDSLGDGLRSVKPPMEAFTAPAAAGTMRRSVRDVTAYARCSRGSAAKPADAAAEAASSSGPSKKHKRPGAAAIAASTTNATLLSSIQSDLVPAHLQQWLVEDMSALLVDEGSSGGGGGAGAGGAISRIRGSTSAGAAAVVVTPVSDGSEDVVPTFKLTDFIWAPAAEAGAASAAEGQHHKLTAAERNANAIAEGDGEEEGEYDDGEYEDDEYYDDGEEWYDDEEGEYYDDEEQGDGGSQVSGATGATGGAGGSTISAAASTSAEGSSSSKTSLSIRVAALVTESVNIAGKSVGTAPPQGAGAAAGPPEAVSVEGSITLRALYAAPLPPPVQATGHGPQPFYIALRAPAGFAAVSVQSAVTGGPAVALQLPPPAEGHAAPTTVDVPLLLPSRAPGAAGNPAFEVGVISYKLAAPTFPTVVKTQASAKPSFTPAAGGGEAVVQGYTDVMLSTWPHPALPATPTGVSFLLQLPPPLKGEPGAPAPTDRTYGAPFCKPTNGQWNAPRTQLLWNLTDSPAEQPAASDAEAPTVANYFTPGKVGRFKARVPVTAGLQLPSAAVAQERFGNPVALPLQVKFTLPAVILSPLRIEPSRKRHHHHAAEVEGEGEAEQSVDAVSGVALSVAVSGVLLKQGGSNVRALYKP